MKKANQLNFFWVLALLLFTDSFAYSNEWVPVKDHSLIVERNSILDFSKINVLEAPIKHSLKLSSEGQISKLGFKANRFLIANISFGGSVGGFPSHNIIDLYIQQLLLNGYNMARLDMLELVLMQAQKEDFDYREDQLDRFHYLVFQLKQHGVHLILNGLSTNAGGYGNIQNRWGGKGGLNLGVHFNTEKQAHWKKLIKTMYGIKNPYTGMTTLEDPVLFGIILAKENNLSFRNRNGTDPDAKRAFSYWLKRKYKNQEGLQKAWGNELKANELLSNATVNFPRADDWLTMRMADVQAFNVETEKKTADWMTSYLRSLGFKGLVTAYNFSISPAHHATRGNLPWVDMHNYFGHPKYVSKNDMRVRQDSMLGTDANYIGEFMSTRHLNKPFTVTEHGQVFWNPYRRENAIALPAYAAFQGWTGICQHASALNLSYTSLKGRDDIIKPFNLGVDPIAKVTERLSALLFLRGDVAKAKHMLSVNFDESDAFMRSGYLGAMPKDVSRLGLVTGIGLNWLGKNIHKSIQSDGEVGLNDLALKVNSASNEQLDLSDKFKNKLIKVISNTMPSVAEKANKTQLVSGNKWATRLALLKEGKLLTTGNRSNAANHIYHSDTEEILLDAQNRMMTVITPKTEAVVFDTPKPRALDQLKIISAEGPALVSISAMDDNVLHTSKRMLLMLATDARNSQMQFQSNKHLKATSLGKLPVIMKANRVRLSISNANASQLKVFSVNLRGQRKDEIPIKSTEHGIEIELDIRDLTHGATNYFEVTTH